MKEQISHNQQGELESLKSEIKELKNYLIQINLSQKKALSFDEGCIFTNRSKSDMYKKTSQGIIPHFCPQGKMIYFDREELEKWMLSNPIKTKAQIEKQASTYITLGRKMGSKK